MEEIHRLMNEDSKKIKCPNFKDGKHRGVQHNSFGDCCCTCGVYILTDANKYLTMRFALRTDHPEQYARCLEQETKTV